MNSFLGYQVALYSRTGSYNVVVGGESSLRIASSYNCVIGYSSATSLVGGGATTVVGALAGATIVSGRANTLVGCAADVGAGNVEDAVAIGSASSVGAKGGVAIGAGATAGGALSLAIGAGAQTASEGEINVINRVCGYRSAQSNKYTLELNADLTRLGGALSFLGPLVVGCLCRCRVAEGEDLLALRPGAVVVATGASCDLDGCEDLLDVDEALPVVTLCRRARDPRVFGVPAPAAPDAPQPAPAPKQPTPAAPAAPAAPDAPQPAPAPEHPTPAAPAAPDAPQPAPAPENSKINNFGVFI
eukprot:gene2031-18269_t